MEYSLKQQKASQKIAFEHNDNTPLVIPADCRQPETYNEAIARILRHSGVIDDGAYEKLRGFSYDGDFDDGDEDFDGFDDDDEFEQSSFARYDDLPLEFDENRVETATNALSEAKPEQMPDRAESAPQGHKPQVESALAEQNSEAAKSASS